ncbi:GrpB family protein [Parvularcula sp. LCG005]|uniref:GrpB family protein n=1 Tax=Parvularcula sp. LCG005 TaxID=3078805 RepID=UPI00294335D1|nr:GrpB family protein [Parvularcula sp. LCG005]WOI53840.1 GrpB family protein [Parvularcula sp. LCG005]
MKRLVPHDPHWAALFEGEAETLSGRLGPTLVQAHHIGSTAIPLIPAKPVIDILLEVTSVMAVDRHARDFTAMGYEVRGEYGIRRRRYFSKRAGANYPGFHVHAYQVGDPEILRHVAFCRYLQMKPEIAAEYAELKSTLCDADGVLFANFQDEKKPWVDEMAQKALRFLTQEIGEKTPCS